MIKKFLTLGLAILGIFTLTACTGDEGYTDEELLTMIQEAMDELDLLDTISTDLTLPNSGLNGVTITWESSDPDIIATDGTVTRPAKTEGNETVRLTATLTLEGQTLIKTFDITVLAEEDLNDAEKVAADTASLFVQEGAVYGDLTLPTSGANGTTITWLSDKPDYISNTGEVTRPAIGEGDEVVTLTATITLNDESDTKVFEFRVIEDVLVMTINEIKTTAEEGDNVLIRALVLGHFKEGTYKGYFAYDGTGYIYIHLGTTAPTVEIGKVYQIAGEYDVYYGMPQIAYPTEQTELDTTMEWPAAIAVTIDDIMAYSTTVPKEKFSQYITLTGTVTYDGTYYYLTDEDGDSVELNDDSDIALVVAELGKSVTINAFYHSYHTGHGNHQISFTGSADDLTVNELSDADALAADVATIALPNAAAFDLTLPTTGINGTTFSNWASSNTAVYGNDGTFIAFGADTVTITFTADAVNGTASETISVEVVVPVLSTIDEVLDFAKDDLFAVEGIVYSISYYGYHIYANGEYIFVNDTSYRDLLTLGDELLIVGYVGGFYHDMIQLKAYGYDIQSQGNVLPTYTAVDLSAAIAGMIEEGTPITVTGEILVETGTYVDVYILDALGNQVQIHYNSNDNELEAYNGQVVTIDVLVYTWDYLWFEGVEADATVASFSDADKAAAILYQTIADLGNLNGIATDLTLPTSFADPAATIAWVSDDAGVITNDGVITIAYGSEASATLTVTVTVGTETATADVVVTLIDGNDLTPLSVADALLEDDGKTVLVTGIVTGFNPYGDPFIQDADGTAIILEYFDANDVTVNVGDEIVAIGVIDTDTYYDERRLIDDATLVSVTSTGNTVFIIEDQLPAIGIEANSLDLTNKIYTMDLTVATAPANASANPVIDTYGYVFFVGDGSTYFTMDADEFAPYFADMYQVGDVLTITFIISDVHFNNLRIYPTVLPELTEAQKFTAVEAMLDLPSNTITDLTLPAAYADYDATIVWTSSNTAVITDAGVVTRPAVGAGDATVTMTAAVTIGSTTQNFTFDVVVPQEVADAANVASAIAAADGDALFIEGVVTSVLADGTFTIEDADGTAIYVDDYSTTYADFDVDVVVAVGDLVQVTATKSNYNGFHSIDTVSLVTIVSNGNAITDPIVVSDIAAFRAAVAADSFGKRYVFTNVVLNDSGYYLYFYDESGANRMGIVESMSSNIATTLATADVLNMVVTLYGSSGTYTDSTKILRFAITQDADALVLTNVAGAIAAAADDALYFSGVVTSVLPDGTFTVEDADGTAIYVDDYNTAFADFDVDVVVTVGDMVQIVAAKSDYNGYHSIDSVSYVSIESSGNAITDAIAVSDIAAWKAAATADSFGKRYVFTDVTIDDAGYYLYFYNVDGTNRMGVVESMSSAIAATIGSGDTVTMTVTLYGTNGTFTDASKIFRFAITQDSDATITPAP